MNAAVFYVLGAQLSFRYFFMKMPVHCEKMITNESFEVLPIVSYNFCPSFW